MTILTGYIKKDLLKSNKNPKIRSMNHQNLANLTTQYQQTYLIYCFKIMQYLSLLAWMEQQQRPPQHKVKPKSASGVKKLAQRSNQEKSTFKSLKHQEKPDVSTIVAMGFPNGAMSAAFRVAFNHFGASEEKLNQIKRSAIDNGTNTATEFDKIYGDVGFDSESLFQAGVGLGDGLTLGFTKWLRGSTGVDGGVNTGSAGYVGGFFVGSATSTIATIQATAARGAYSAGYATVSSWAPAGVNATIQSGRWVMVGNATKLNYRLSGVWGPSFTNGVFRSASPYANSITQQIPITSLAFPRIGEGFWRGVMFGQRVVK